MDPHTVVITRTPTAGYPETAPFHPDERFPEYGFSEICSGAPNPVYRAVRESLWLAGLDRDNFGTPNWNPLSEFIRPGQFVLLKPNLVKEIHPRDPNGWIYTITHGSVIRSVADFVWKALKGQGRVMVADAPQTDSSFTTMVRLLGLDQLADFYADHDLHMELVDFRKEEWNNVDEVIVDRRPLDGDPNGYVAFNLAQNSEFAEHHGEGRYYGADYDEGEVNRHHSGGRHEYLVAGSAVQCDVFINLPKLKTHKKAGVTVNLKNLVGVNGDKNWLPHHTVGAPENGGDQFPTVTSKRNIEHLAAKSLRRLALALPGPGTWLLRRARAAGKHVFGDTDQVIRSGNWYGNDTTWRMCLDLNKAVFYGNQDGTLRSAESKNRKTYLSFVDGVIGGQGDGPMNPDPLESRAILFGTDAAAVDACAALLLGFDLDQIPIIRNAFHCRGFPITDCCLNAVHCVSNHAPWSGALPQVASSTELLNARAHFGWVGHVEATTA